MAELVVDRPRPSGIAAARERAARSPAATVVLAVLMLIGAVLFMYVGRRLTFFYDEWDYVVYRRNGSLGSFLDPHNGHLSLFPVLVYKALFATVGMRSYFAYRLITVLLHLLCVGLIFVIARRRLGQWGALLLAGLLLFLGTGWEDILWPFQIGYFGSIVGGLGALAVLDADPPPQRVWPAAALLTLSIISSGVGIPFLIAAAALMLMRRAPWRQFWVIAVPALVWLAWYAGWGGGDQTSRNAILGAPQYIANAAAGAAAGLTGLDPATWGAVLAVALIAGLAVAWHRRGAGPPTAMLVAALVGALAFWVLTAVVRAGPAEPAASRYVYVGVVFILLLAAEVGRGLRWRGSWLWVGAVVLLGVFVAQLSILRNGEGGLRGADDSVRGSLAAVQIAAHLVPGAFELNPSNAPQLTAGAYLSAERDLGSPAPTVSELERSSSVVETEADSVLAHAETLNPANLTGLSPAPIKNDALYGAVSTPRGACEQIAPRAALASLDLTVPSGMAISIRPHVGPAANVYVRRFASAFAPPAFTSAAGGTTTTVGFPRDLAAQIPWHVQVVDPLSFEVCPAT